MCYTHGQRPKKPRVIGSAEALKLELQAVVSHLMRVLGTKLRSFGRAGSTLFYVHGRFAAQVSVSHMHAWCLQQPEKGIRVPGSCRWF